ncbi:hypothetical protein SLEP1_g44262 [Rubroshorea leprosula]|uniref:Uncharacterized protein n=1 Tax=Rubroshorea leprosula TaxID=152421 RepID=A0AAV5LFN3_9ROSI|nr:hypothetical protein SLEP1_g44262 [Rubroshorea leprosula]
MAPSNINSPTSDLTPKSKQQKRKGIMKKLKPRIRKLKEQMEEIGNQQKCIKEEQRKVTQKFKMIESQCHHLKKETQLISQQSAATRFQLALLFQILKAREDNDFNKANDLTRSLREFMIAKNNTKWPMHGH